MRDGRVCTYSSTDAGIGSTVENSLTQKYTDVREGSDGTHFTLESVMEITTSTDEQYSEADPLLSETQSLEYVLGGDGLLRTAPQQSNREDFEANVDGFIVYPSIAEIREGGSTSSSVKLSGSASDPATQAELEAQLEPGESEMKMRMDYKVTGLPPEEISTPAGTFTDVVGVSIKIKDIEVLNANEEARRELDQMAEVVNAFGGTPIVWFARDVGIVQTETEGGMMEDMSSAIKLVGCDGEQTRAQSQTSSNDGEKGASEAPEPAPPEDSGDSDTEGDISASDDSEKASLSQAVGDYYLAAGAEEWAYTYDHLDSQTRSMFTEDEWSRKNQWFWDRNPVMYHILSTESNGNAEGSIAEVEVRITGKDGSSSMRITYFVQEDGEWKHRFSEAETSLFMPDATYEEFVEAQADASS